MKKNFQLPLIKFPSPLGVISSLTFHGSAGRVGWRVSFPSPLGVISSLTEMQRFLNREAEKVSVPSRGYLFLNRVPQVTRTIITTRFPSPLGVISSLTERRTKDLFSREKVSVPSRGYLFLNPTLGSPHKFRLPTFICGLKIILSYFAPNT